MKRYDIGREYAHSVGAPAITEQPIGAYVRHDDHTALVDEWRAEKAALEQIVMTQEVTIAELREGMGGAPAWQPIATAPSDGRTLLLGCFNSLGNWRTMCGQWMGEDYIAEYWEEPDGAEPGWFETSVEADDPPNCWRIEPTHWMPLPEAPCAALTQQEQV